jgi:hypothetical protein
VVARVARKLSVEVPGYAATLHLKTNVHSRPPGVRAAVVLEPTDQPLVVEQREGITLARLEQLATVLLHG